jgi:anti-sigma regulatory factor (Ser/Thr protein kinase)
MRRLTPARFMEAARNWVVRGLRTGIPWPSIDADHDRNFEDDDSRPRAVGLWSGGVRIMRIRFPNSAHLQNIGGFITKMSSGNPAQLRFSMYDRYLSVHPFVLALTAAEGAYVSHVGGRTTGKLYDTSSLKYLVRMGLFNFVELTPPTSVAEHEAAGRFIPLTQIRTSDELEEFIVEMIPLLHAAPVEAGPIKFVMSELVRNVLEHAASPVGALVCAQYYKKTKRLSVGVADRGIGIRASIGRSHPSKSALDAIQLALRPGITGTTNRFGGNEYNAGAGLFLVKSMAQASRNFFVVYSDDALFKLLKTPSKSDSQITADPSADRARRVSGVPAWPGTAIGIDLNVAAHETFQELLVAIQKAYDLDVRLQKRASYRKARFIR